MRLTVGPLPPAVYWRRRAVVLGAILLVIVVLTYSCAGSDRSDANDAAGKARAAPNAAVSAAASARVPTEGPPSAASSPGAEPLGSTPSAGQPIGPCTDAEVTVSVTPDGGRLEYVVGTYVKVFLKIKNVSSRSCTRDLGAIAQELRLTAQGNQKVWSSDDCVPAGTGTDVRTLRPGEQLGGFHATWNARYSTDCKTMPLTPAGAYQFAGRFGTRWSDPVTITVKPRA